MKIRKTSLLALSLTLIMVLGMTVTAGAESTGYEWESRFTGTRIVSNFDSGEIADAVSDLQPGDDVTFEVSYVNDYNGDTDWYMENTVIQTLEKTQGTNASGGGYTYELIHEDSTGATETLFSNERVGGEATPNNMEGLEQATNALDEWFYLETLGYGDSGKVTLRVAFEGETQANDYMDTDGELDLRFAVEIPETDKRIVKTGDSNMLGLWSVVCLLAAALLLILAVFSRRKDRKAAASGGSDTKGGDL